MIFILFRYNARITASKGSEVVPGRGSPLGGGGACCRRRLHKAAACCGRPRTGSDVVTEKKIEVEVEVERAREMERGREKQETCLKSSLVHYLASHHLQ